MLRLLSFSSVLRFLNKFIESFIAVVYPLVCEGKIHIDDLNTQTQTNMTKLVKEVSCRL